MPAGTSPMRLFVAAYPPPDLAAALLRRADALGLPGRATPADQVHLTLQFIGDTPARDLDAVIESVRRAAAGLPAIPLRLGRLILLPERGPARLLAAATDGADPAPPTLRELHHRLATRLARRLREDDADRFTPHLTLRRFPAPTAGLTIDPADARLDDEAWTIDRVRLMRSVLRPGGALHAEVAGVTLGA